MNSRSLLLTAVVALAGCSLTLDTKELDPLLDAQGFCETADSEAIKTVTRCFSMTSGYDELIYGLLRTYSDSIALDVAAGTVAYSQGAAQACIDEMRAARCGDIFGSLFGGGCPAIERFGAFPMPGICSASCRAALAGTVGVDGACTSDLQCSSGHCSIPALTCGGACVQGTSGDPCDFRHGCADGFYCNGGACTAYASSIGALCDFVACNPATLYCDWSISPRTCQPLAGANASCGGVPGAVCAAGLYCDPGNICRTKAPLGSSCGVIPCGNGLSCDSVRAECIPTPTRPEPLGGDCNPPRFCDEDVAYCDTAGLGGTYKCLAKKTVGSCMSPDECALSHYCDFTSGLCLPFKDIGQSCTIGSHECRLGGACVPKLAGGSWCVRQPTTVGAECGSFGGGETIDCFGNLTCDESTIPGRCVALKAAGDPCVGSYECADDDRGAYCASSSGTCSARCW
jgi:hypothetical protein